MAKIHTVEWTPGILANPVLERAMHANWYGVLPRWVRQKFGHVGTEMIGGIVGSDQAHHAAPYSITEEFVSVYRLHPLLPDDYEIRDHRNGELIAETDFDPIQGHGTRPTIDEYGLSNLLYSFGVANPGAITLHNHPRALSNHVRLNGDRVDLGTIDILRDRERGVRALQRLPREAAQARGSRSSRTSPTTPSWASEIRRRLRRRHRPGRPPGRDARRAAAAGLRLQRHGVPDLHPDGVAAAASRTASSPTTTRPTSTRPRGIDWVEDNTMVDVLLRHHPELAPALEGVRERVRALAQARAERAARVSELPSASLLENARFNALVVVPNARPGHLPPPPRGGRRGDPGRTSTARRSACSRACAAATAAGPVWVRVVRDRALLLLTPADVHRALEGSPDPFASDPKAKRDGHGRTSSPTR